MFKDIKDKLEKSKGEENRRTIKVPDLKKSQTELQI